MKETDGTSDGGHDAQPDDVPSFEELAYANESTLDAEGLMDAEGECAKAMAFFQARQTEFLAEFGRRRSDPATRAGGNESPEPERDSEATADSKAKNDTPASGNHGHASGATFRDVLSSGLARWAGDEVACELDIAGITGTTRLLDGMLAAWCLPRTLAALKAGRLSARRFRKIVEAARHLPAELAEELDGEVAEWNDDITFGTFGRRLARWLITRQARQAEHDRQRTARDRSVQFSPDRDGAAWLTIFGPADRLRALYNQIDAAARAHDGTQENDWHEPDRRTLDQIRFDLLTSARISTQGGHEVDPARYRVAVTVPFVTLLGAELPAELAGYGPIPAAMGRQIAAGAKWIERILTDPATGRPLDADRNRYRLTARMRAFIYSRDRECTLPSCSKPAEACEIDHPPPQSGGRYPQSPGKTAARAACPKRSTFIRCVNRIIKAKPPKGSTSKSARPARLDRPARALSGGPCPPAATTTSSTSTTPPLHATRLRPYNASHAKPPSAEPNIDGTDTGTISRHARTRSADRAHANRRPAVVPPSMTNSDPVE